MKKLLIPVIMFMTIITLTGCVDSDITLNIDKKGNTSISTQILSSDYLMGNLNEQDLKTKYDKVEKITEPGKSGFKITENLGNIADLNVKDNKDISEYADVIDMKKEEKFLYNIYDVNIKLKDYMKKNMTNEEMGVLNLFGSNFDLDFHLNTPIKLIESNATSSSEKNGIYTYNWDFTLSSLENIHAKVKVPNITNICILLVGILLVIILLIVLIIKKKKNKSKINKK
jgi:hypothetical protein